MIYTLHMNHVNFQEILFRVKAIHPKKIESFIKSKDLKAISIKFWRPARQKIIKSRLNICKLKDTKFF